MSLSLSIGAAAPLFSLSSSLHSAHGDADDGEAADRASYADSGSSGAVPHGSPFPPPPLHLVGSASVGQTLRNQPSGRPTSGDVAEGADAATGKAASLSARTDFQNAILRGIGRGLFGDAIGGSIPLIEILKQFK